MLVFRPGIGTENMDPVEIRIRRDQRNQMPRFHAQELQIGNASTPSELFHFAQTSQHDIRPEDQRLRL